MSDMRGMWNRLTLLLRGAALPAVTAVMLICFFVGLGNLDQGQEEESRRRLEESLHQAAAACYAAEGIYPPTLDYLEKVCGIQIDQSHYAVFYEIFAENLMPEITVVELEP